VCAGFGQSVHMEAVLLTGLFGVGKSTIAAEMADLLEGAGVPYAALDLDWLTWCNVGDGDRASEHAMLLRNLKAVVANYRAGGVRYFVLARWIRDRDELAGLIATMAMPLHTVELVVPLDEITRRIETDPTAGRLDDLAESVAWLEDGGGVGFAEYTVDNDRPVREVAADILRWLAWPPHAGG
jgi:adenylylsulfate kinase